MKNLVLLFTGLLMGLTTVTAAENVKSASQGEDLTTNRYSFDQPIQFIERGVEFLIFPDGSFDFNTNIENNHYNNSDVYYRKSNTRRTNATRSVNHTFGAPGTQVSYAVPRSRGVIITHDASGKVRRIGNVFVNYNRYAKVKRLGSVYINYNRRGWLTKVGGLHISYNRNGQITNVHGQVNYRNQDCNTTFFGNNNNQSNGWNNDLNNDEDYFYYRKNGKVEKKKKNKTIKRKR